MNNDEKKCCKNPAIIAAIIAGSFTIVVAVINIAPDLIGLKAQPTPTPNLTSSPSTPTVTPSVVPQAVQSNRAPANSTSILWVILGLVLLTVILITFWIIKKIQVKRHVAEEIRIVETVRNLKVVSQQILSVLLDNENHQLTISQVLKRKQLEHSIIIESDFAELVNCGLVIKINESITLSKTAIRYAASIRAKLKERSILKKSPNDFMEET